MFKMISNYKWLTPKALAIVNEDLETLEYLYQQWWDINKNIKITSSYSDSPFKLALSENKTQSIWWFVEKNVQLQWKSAPLTIAVRNCSIEIVEFLIKKGASIHDVNWVWVWVIEAALFEKRYELLPRLVEIGYNIKKDGNSLRYACSENDLKAVKILLSFGIDVNLHKRDQVFPSNPTAVCTAADEDNFEMVKLLVEHGADITIKDTYGDRPYTYAVRNKNKEMTEYLKSLEPEEWHNEECIKASLKKAKMPDDLIRFLQRKNRTLLIPENKYIKEIRLIPLHLVTVVKYEGEKYYNITEYVSDYEYIFLWYPKKKLIVGYDVEHQEIMPLGSWKDFYNTPDAYINKLDI